MSDSTINNPDPTLLDLFRAEVEQHLPVLADGLLAFEKGGGDPKQIDSLMRAAHSIKGAARIVRNDPAVRLAHAMEDCLAAAREGKIALASGAIDILLQAADGLGRMCAPDSSVEPADEGLGPLLNLLSSVKEGAVPLAPATTASAAGPTEIEARRSPAADPPSSEPDTLAVPAKLDPVTLESLRIRLCEMLKGPGKIRLDFCGSDRTSTALLALLLSFAREVRNVQPASSCVEAVRVAPAVRTLLRVVGLDAVFKIVD